MNLEYIPCEPNISRPEIKNGILHISSECLTFLAEKAFARLSFTFPREHLERLVNVANGAENSPNDRMIASLLLENAVISARGIYPLCQDTGIANIFAWKDNTVMTAGDDDEALSAGAEKTYTERNLRFSTTLPDTLFDERDPGNNMPAQVFIAAATETPNAGPAYRFLFCAKGGGSSNKTTLVQGTKALLNATAFGAFLRTQIPKLRTAACPPYSIAVVVGGLSPEQNLLALKLATAGCFDDSVPGWDTRVLGSEILRDEEWESETLRIAEETGLGAQFGGRALAISARVLRLPRHGASCPVSIGVSCSAHRNLRGIIDRNGIALERTEENPLSVPGLAEAVAHVGETATNGVTIDLDAGITAARAALSGLSVGTPVFLSGKLLVARDAAHARWRKNIEIGQPLPDYVSRYAILYAGPARTPEGCATGSFGPTTAGRMDEYAECLMSRDAALVTIAKGDRSETWRAACETYKATYLGTIGGAAALIADKYISASEIIDYPDLGMEAVRLVTVRNLPSFMLVNDKGEAFYESIRRRHTWLK